MIWKIITSFFFLELLIAFVICVAWLSNGIEPHVIKISGPFLAFLRQCNLELSQIVILIPSIPRIEPLPSDSGVLEFVNFLIEFINGISSLFNAFIGIFNVILKLIEFMVVLLKNAITLALQLQNGDPYVSPFSGSSTPSPIASSENPISPFGVGGLLHVIL